jgi:hypothetical protein
MTFQEEFLALLKKHRIAIIAKDGWIGLGFGD